MPLCRPVDASHVALSSVYPRVDLLVPPPSPQGPTGIFRNSVRRFRSPRKVVVSCRRQQPVSAKWPLPATCWATYSFLILPTHSAEASVLYLGGKSSRHRVVVDDDTNTSGWGCQLDLGSLGKSSLGEGQCPVKARSLTLGQATLLSLLAWAQLSLSTWPRQRCL